MKVTLIYMIYNGNKHFNNMLSEFDEIRILRPKS